LRVLARAGVIDGGKGKAELAPRLPVPKPSTRSAGGSTPLPSSIRAPRRSTASDVLEGKELNRANIYLENGAMVGIYFKTTRLPIRY